MTGFSPEAGAIPSEPAEALSAWMQLIQGEVIADPYPSYRRMRAAGPVWLNGYGQLVVTGWSECEQLLRDERWGHDLALDAEQSGRADWWRHPSLAVDRFVMLRMNGADHRRVRGPMARHFTARRIAQLGALVEAETTRLLDHVDVNEPVDVVAALALPVPIFMIGELLGVPPSDRAAFIPWTRTSILEPIFTDEQLVAADEAMGQMWDYMRGLVADKRAHPDDGLVSALAGPAEESYCDDELIANLLLLFGAGVVTTVHLIGSMFVLLGEHPEAQQRLREGRTPIQAAIDETLRLEAPVQMTARRALTDLSIGGEQIAKDQLALLYLAGANRDPERFREPDRFWPERPDAGVLSFGTGAHFCLGAALARMEGEVVLNCALKHLDQWHVAAAVRQPTVPLRGFDSVKIGF